MNYAPYGHAAERRTHRQAPKTERNRLYNWHQKLGCTTPTPSTFPGAGEILTKPHLGASASLGRRVQDLGEHQEGVVARVRFPAPGELLLAVPNKAVAKWGEGFVDDAVGGLLAGAGRRRWLAVAGAGIGGRLETCEVEQVGVTGVKSFIAFISPFKVHVHTKHIILGSIHRGGTESILGIEVHIILCRGMLCYRRRGVAGVYQIPKDTTETISVLRWNHNA